MAENIAEKVLQNVYNEVRTEVRKDYRKEIIELKQQLREERRENKRLASIENELMTAREKVKKEKEQVKVVAAKILRHYNKLQALKKKSVGSVITDSYDWRRVNKERAAITALKKKVA